MFIAAGRRGALWEAQKWLDHKASTREAYRTATPRRLTATQAIARNDNERAIDSLSQADKSSLESTEATEIAEKQQTFNNHDDLWRQHFADINQEAKFVDDCTEHTSIHKDGIDESRKYWALFLKTKKLCISDAVQNQGCLDDMPVSILLQQIEAGHTVDFVTYCESKMAVKQLEQEFFHKALVVF